MTLSETCENVKGRLVRANLHNTKQERNLQLQIGQLDRTADIKKTFQ